MLRRSAILRTRSADGSTLSVDASGEHVALAGAGLRCARAPSLLGLAASGHDWNGRLDTALDVVGIELRRFAEDEDSANELYTSGALGMDATHDEDDRGLHDALDWCFA